MGVRVLIDPGGVLFLLAPRWTTGPTSCRRNSCSTIPTRRRLRLRRTVQLAGIRSAHVDRFTLINRVCGRRRVKPRPIRSRLCGPSPKLSGKPVPGGAAPNPPRISLRSCGLRVVDA